MAEISCTTSTAGRRRKFWSTQICGSQPDACGGSCATFGMVLLREDQCGDGNCNNTGDIGCQPAGRDVARSISTANWVKGLMINILMTDGLTPDSACGFPVGRRGAHWSDSFRTDGLNTGSNIRAVPAGKTVQANVLALQVEAQKSADKLVAYGVAHSVAATVTYAGGSKYALNIDIVGSDGTNSNVGLTGARLVNEFQWT